MEDHLIAAASAALVAIVAVAIVVIVAVAIVVIVAAAVVVAVAPVVVVVVVVVVDEIVVLHHKMVFVSPSILYIAPAAVDKVIDIVLDRLGVPVAFSLHPVAELSNVRTQLFSTHIFLD